MYDQILIENEEREETARVVEIARSLSTKQYAVKIKALKDILFHAKIIKHKSIVIVLQTFDIIRLNASQIYH